MAARGLLAVAGTMVALAACGGGAERARLVVETSAGDIVLDVEVADSTQERRQGLMGRESLAERSGMLFVYEEDRRDGFWMKDTLIPLSVAFVDADGRILEIVDMAPCRADPCPVYEARRPYRTALELNRGAFERLGIAVGDQVVGG